MFTMAFVSRVCVLQSSFVPSQTCLLKSPRSPALVRSLVPRATLHSPPTTTTPPLQRTFETFVWRGYSINYRVDGSVNSPPILLVHGFGASINHWRKNIPALSSSNLVYTIDLLGFGASAKASPDNVTYGIELWKELVIDFIHEKNHAQKWVLVGNSIGSLVILAATKELGEEKVRALALMNCAGGLVSFRYSELNIFQALLLRLFNLVLFNPIIGPLVFSNFRKRETIKSVLQQVYIDKSAVTDELVDILYTPSTDDGACQVFLAILNADAGPTPEELLQQLHWCPMLVMWGEKDPWTPFDRGLHPGKLFPSYHPNIDLRLVPNGGHCIHDEYPELVNSSLLSFLHSLN